MKTTTTKKSKFGIGYNVSYKLTDSLGRAKKLFQPNKLGVAIGKTFGAVPSFFLFGSMQNEMVIPNLVTTVGKAAVAGLINGVGAVAEFTYIELGTGTTAAAVTDTALETAITDSGLARAAASASLITTDTTNDTAKLDYTFTATGTKAVTESGVFNAASAGTILAHQVFSSIGVSSGDNLQIVWTFDID